MASGTPSAPLGMPSPSPAVGGRRERASIWRLVVVVSAVLGYLALTGVVAGSGSISYPLGLAASGILLGAALVGFVGWGLALGHFSGLWPGFVFVAAYCVFHFASLGDLDAGWYAPSLAPLAWFASVVALCFWIVGYGWGRGARSFVAAGQRRPALGARELSPAALRRLGRLGTALFVLGFASELLIYARIGLGAGWTYLSFKTAMNSQAGVGAMHLLAQMCCVVGMILSVTAASLLRRRVFSSAFVAALAGAYVLNLAWQGDRSELGVFLFPLFLVRHYLVRPFRSSQMLALGLAALITVAGLKAFRSDNQAATVVRKVQDPSWIVHKTANETGHTLDTFVRSLELVPGRYDYFRGQTYLDALSRVVPNLIWERPDAIVSSVWLTDETSDRKSEGKGGLGFSIVAEAYINFGLLGAPLLLGLIGWLHGWAERIMTRRRLRVELFVLFTIAELGLLVHVRNSAVLYIRGTLWMSSILLATLSVFMLYETMRRRR